jgi:hypothetical protein
MARRTALDFVQEVRDIAGGETAETLSNTRILRYVNQALLAYETKYLFPQNKTYADLTTADGTSQYSLGVHPIQIESVVDRTNYLRLRPINQQQYDEYVHGNPTGTKSSPVEWFVSGQTGGSWYITFFPTPNAVTTQRVNYWGHTDLVLSPSATSPIIPIAFDDAVLLRAASAALRQARDFEGSYKLQLSANDAENFAKGIAHRVSWKPIRATSLIVDAMR